MGKEIDLSIVVPFFKGEKYIVNLLESIFNSYKAIDKIINIELLLIIDSMDTSIISLKKSIDKFIEPLSISIFKNEANIGVAKTRNYGIEISKGQYLYFIDQDDEVTVPFFSKLLGCSFQKYEFLLLNGLLSYKNGFKCRIYYLRPSINLKSLIMDDYIRSPGQVLIKRMLLLNNKIRFPVPDSHYGSDDKFFYISIFKLSNPKFLYVGSRLYKANIHESNYSNNQVESVLSSLELFKRFKEDYLLTSNETVHFENSMDVLLFRLGAITGIKKARAFFNFLSYKIKPNKIIRYMVKLTRYLRPV